jgi:hypothetical protein
MKLTARVAHWANAPGGGIMLVDETGHKVGVFMLDPGYPPEYSKALTDQTIKHINANEFKVELPPRIV